MEIIYFVIRLLLIFICALITKIGDLYTSKFDILGWSFVGILFVYTIYQLFQSLGWLV